MLQPVSERTEAQSPQYSKISRAGHATAFETV
uniref:Uncharacterized protein n=1 Tax=Arundo donax TaxID=35708 RepID=A0A0A8ZMZ7_ARUDO